MEKKVIRIGSVGLGGIWTGVHEPGDVYKRQEWV